MPYHWSRTNTAKTLRLRPHRSLPIRGFAVVFLSLFLLAMIPLFGLIGTSLLWGMLPFVLITLAGLYWAFMHTYNTGDAREVLTITPEQVTLSHTPPKGAPLIWRCNTHWVRAQIYPKDGPVPHYITLTGNHREVELGSFLSEDERKHLFSELQSALQKAKNRPAP